MWLLNRYHKRYGCNARWAHWDNQEEELCCFDQQQFLHSATARNGSCRGLRQHGIPYVKTLSEIRTGSRFEKVVVVIVFTFFSFLFPVQNLWRHQKSTGSFAAANCLLQRSISASSSSSEKQLEISTEQFVTFVLYLGEQIRFSCWAAPRSSKAGKRSGRSARSDHTS